MARHKEKALVDGSLCTYIGFSPNSHGYMALDIRAGFISAEC
jgi:hypothetical protein